MKTFSRVRSAAFLACVILASLPTPVLAQSSTGQITGTVVDSTGGGLPGATVTATQAETGAVRSTTSTGTGVFTLPLLPIGDYSVAAELPGFAPTRAANVNVAVGGDSSLRLVMEPAGVQAAVTVTGEAPLIQSTRSQVDSVVNERAIQNLPANGRNFIDFVLTTPGVVKDNFRVGDIVFAGQRGTLNSLVVDGADNNNTFFGQALGRTGTGRAPYQFSQDTVKEFQVNLNAYTAEYGRAGGAVINVVTKSGTNDFHGSGFYFYRDRKLNEIEYFDEFNNRPKAPYHYDQFGGSLGGPIIREKLFFFANYDGQRNTTPNTVVLNIPANTPTDPDTVAGIQRLEALAGSWDRKQDQDTFFLKTDWEMFSNSRFTLRYNRQDFTGVGFESGGSNIAFEHTGDSLVETDTIAGSLTTSLSPTVFNELRGQWAKDHEPGTANSSNPEATINQSGATVLIIGENFFSPRETTIKRFQIADTLTWLLGSHTLRGGADYLQDEIFNFFPGNFFGSYTFASIGSFHRGVPSGTGERYVQAFAGPGTSGPVTNPDQTDISGFMQDEWRIRPSFTLNLGVRYDYQDITQPETRNLDPQLLAAGLFTDVIPVDEDNFAGRLGFAWSPNDQTVVRGGYGLFYGRTPAIMVGTAHSNNGINVSTITFTGASVPTYPNRFDSPPAGGAAAVPSIALFDPQFENPTVHQASIGVDRALTTDLAIGVSYLYVKGEDLPRSIDINVGTPVDTPVPIQGDGTATVRRYTSRPFPNFFRVVQFQSSAESEYNGLTLELNKRYSRNWQAKVAYTYSKVIDTKPDATAVVVSSTDDAKYAMDPLDLEGDKGPGDNDVRHRAVLSGVWNLDYAGDIQNPFMRALASGWTIAGIFSFQTGMPYSRQVNGDLNNDRNDRNDRSPGAKRNAERLPSTASFDPRISRHIPIGPVDVELIVEAFNLFNKRNTVGILATDYRTVVVAGQTQLAPVLTYLDPCAGGRGCTAQAPLSTTTGPRIVQLAARVSF